MKQIENYHLTNRVINVAIIDSSYTISVIRNVNDSYKGNLILSSDSGYIICQKVVRLSYGALFRLDISDMDEFMGWGTVELDKHYAQST